MGERQTTLSRMLVRAGYAVQPKGALPRPSGTCRGRNSTWDEINRVYQRLDGVLPLCPIQPGPWDIELPKFAVELDEEQHFNLYRKLTLESDHYKADRFPLIKYSSFCEQYANECQLKGTSRAGYWTNASAIKQFGPAGPRGDLRPPGSPRWKQRAFYDFLKDLAPILVGTAVARIAIWDIVVLDGSPVCVRDVLDRNLIAAVPGLLALIRERSGFVGADVTA